MALLLSDPDTGRGTVDVDIVVPVYNEEAGLAASVERLHRYLESSFPLTWTITVVDNASVDATWAVACRVANELPGVRAMHLDAKGRGRALRAAWQSSTAAIVAYMDVDLSTDLDALLPLVAPLLSGHSDVAIGTRLDPAARVVRGPRREVISRAYNLILRVALHNRFSDAQCGFKAVRADVARALLPLVEDEGWFFDTELLALAEHNGLRIHEVPVDWADDPDSRVDVASTARDDLKGVWRMVRRFAAGGGTLSAPLGPVRARRSVAGEVVRFAGVGVVSTALFALLYALLAPSVGAYAADVLALVTCGAANTTANRRLTFAASGPAGRRRYYRTALVAAALPLVLTLAALEAVAGTGLGVQLLALTVANATATAARFALLRTASR